MFTTRGRGKNGGGRRAEQASRARRRASANTCRNPSRLCACRRHSGSGGSTAMKHHQPLVKTTADSFSLWETVRVTAQGDGNPTVRKGARTKLSLLTRGLLTGRAPHPISPPGEGVRTLFVA